jgi:hypothetical protein
MIASVPISRSNLAKPRKPRLAASKKRAAVLPSVRLNEIA